MSLLFLDDNTTYHICEELDIYSLLSLVQTNTHYANICYDVVKAKFKEALDELEQKSEYFSNKSKEIKSRGNYWTEENHIARAEALDGLVQTMKDTDKLMLEANQFLIRLIIMDPAHAHAHDFYNMVMGYFSTDIVIDLIMQSHEHYPRSVYRAVLDFLQEIFSTEEGFGFMEVGDTISKKRIPIAYEDLVRIFPGDEPIEQLRNVVEGTSFPIEEKEELRMSDYLLDNFSLSEIIEMARRNSILTQEPFLQKLKERGYSTIEFLSSI